jgi:hypothetical protein
MTSAFDTGTSRAGSRCAPQYCVYLEKAVLHGKILRLQVSTPVTREQ